MNIRHRRDRNHRQSLGLTISPTLHPAPRTGSAKAAADADRAAKAAGYAQIARESGGMMEVRIIRPVDARGMFTAAAAGDRDAARLSRALVALLKGANGAAGMQCSVCDVELAGTRFTAVFALPACDDPSKLIAAGLCTACTSDPEARMRRAVQGLRRLFPALRCVEMQGHSAGRA
jgi:hypothetical protein